MKLKILILSIVISLVGCSNNENSKYSENEMRTIKKENYQKDLDNLTVLLGYKNNIDENKVQSVLLAYMKEVNNRRYQILKQEEFDVAEYRYQRNSNLNLKVLIPKIADSINLSNTEVAKIIYDNQLLNYKNDFNAILDEIMELNGNMKNSN